MKQSDTSGILFGYFFTIIMIWLFGQLADAYSIRSAALKSFGYKQNINQLIEGDLK